jgi:ATP-binding cassette subfamily B protein
VFAAFGEVANLAALLPVLRLLAYPKLSFHSLGWLGGGLQDLESSQLLLLFGFGFMVVVVISSSLRLLTIYFEHRLTGLIAVDLGAHVFRSVLSRPYPWHLQHNSSAILANVTKDVESVARTFKNLLALFINLSIILLLGLALLIFAPGPMSALASILSLAYIITYRFTSASLSSDGARSNGAYKQAIKAAQEALGGIRDILLDRTQPTFQKQFYKSSRDQYLAMASIDFKAQSPRYVIEGFSLVVLVGFCLVLAFHGENLADMLPLLGTMVVGAYRILQPLQQCFVGFSLLQSNNDSLKQLLPFLSSELGNNGTAYRDQVGSPIAFDSELTLQKVSFAYQRSFPPVLQDLQLTIPVGTRIGLVGSTGSGKTTCCDLILGLLQPSKGRVLIDGIDLHAQPNLLASWQRSIAHVPQHIFLSDASFAENIAFGHPNHEIDHELVRSAASQALISDVIESYPGGYDSQVGERGVRLSGGQRQRIGIARALYKQARVLVLDEATSALDNSTEAQVMETIYGLDRRLTLILIAHRLSTVRSCDQIVLLESGSIKAFGSYESLMETSGEFRKLVRSPV